MELREPKAKKRVSEPHDLPFPLTFDENTKQIIQYTAHLSTSGTCIVHPEEIKAVYRMGYFGKGSLSRSAPCFGKRRFGAPPQVRERQWQRRKTWLEDLKNLEAESFTFTPETSNDPSKSIDDPGKSTDGPSQPASDLFLEVIEDTTGEKINKPIPPQSSPLSSKEPKKKSLNSQDFIPLVDKRTRALSEASSVEILVDSDDQQKPSTSSKPPEDTGLESNDKKTVNIENKTNKNNSKVGDDSMDIDEVILDSSEDDICEVNDKISESGTIEEDNYPLESDSYCDNYDNLMDVNETEENLNEVIVLPDSDDDSQDNQDPEVYVKNYMDNVNPRLESDGFPMTETLQLTFEETFFLMYGLGCLQLVNYDGSFFSILDAWKHFNKQDKHFLPRYIVYHYYRSNGWVVKPGIKYGGDYLLYKEGPPFYHASYVVTIDIADADTLARIDGKSMKQLTWNGVLSKNRIITTLGKELVMVDVLWPSKLPRSCSLVPLEALSEFTVRETLFRRWNQNQKDDDYDDEYSDDDDSS